ncbi:proline--tRNA ligase [Paenibacillus turpanensis]|uniref:proline--tRNA ligase n=1 Tax=Paenibacillus turpanensis TaxID=2689078 RepID=UPI00140BB23B|nr:proline--tRNA ligase [Paenibacillus turpanensis]
MKQDKLFLPTLREAPSDAEAVSHQLLLRAGYIRQTASGIYSYLPLGWRVLRKVSEIVREEMDRIDAQELLMPAMQPTELWKESGRYHVYGQELIRFHDRHDREFALGPTHEEVITTLVRSEVSSYRQLPLTLYQIQTKFRDERRPRFGLLRGREFLMKDAYSFHRSWEELDGTYRRMHQAYRAIFQRCGLDFRAVEADAGAIGGEGGTHEFMALADIGEDTVVSCDSCDYAANLEKATAARHIRVEEDRTIAAARAFEKLHTPGVKTIRELVTFTGLEADRLVKTLIYEADGQPVAVLIRGDHEVNETKLKHVLQAEELALADAAITERVTGAPVGFAGPVGLHIPIVIDCEAADLPSMIVGANEDSYHFSQVVAGRDFVPHTVADVRNAAEGDRCLACGGRLEFHRGIEVGHIFKLGTKYSEKLGASVTDESGQEKPLIMGCYGIGISRILSAVVEQNQDENGIIWPAAIAPFHVHIVVVSIKDEVQTALARQIYQSLRRAGLDVLLDDREERVGVKLKDADLVGIPVRIVVGKYAADGRVEWKMRTEREAMLLGVEEACAMAKEMRQKWESMGGGE